MAAVEVDGASGEAALERRGQGVLALAEAEWSVEAGEGDVGMVGMDFRVFRGETAAGHAGGDLCLEVEDRAGRFDLCEEDACSRKGVQAGEFYLQGREVEFGEFVFNKREGGFGDFA